MEFLLIPQQEFHAGVDHRLPLEDIGVVLPRDGDIGEYLKIGLPADAGAGLAASIGLGFQSADIFAFFKMKVVALAVPQHLHIHVFRGILGGAGTQTIKAQGIFVIAVAGAIVLAAGVQLAENQLPIVALFLGVIIHRAAAAKILYLHAAIGIAGGDDLFAVALPGFIDGIGEDLEYRVFAALQTIGAKDDAGALPDAVGALQGGNTLIAVFLFCFCCHGSSPISRSLPSILYQHFGHRSSGANIFSFCAG